MIKTTFIQWCATHPNIVWPFDDELVSVCLDEAIRLSQTSKINDKDITVYFKGEDHLKLIAMFLALQLKLVMTPPGNVCIGTFGGVSVPSDQGKKGGYLSLASQLSIAAQEPASQPFCGGEVV